MRDYAEMARLRWAETQMTEEHKEAVRANGKLGGRPLSKAKRCACGAMTLKRAMARRHRC